jgi:hypothetical protein
MFFKQTKEILSNPWQCTSQLTSVNNVPHKTPWDSTTPITIDDIFLWEELYYKPGNIGIYAAWNPYADFYMITYDLFLDTDVGIEVYSGPTASEDIIHKALELGIVLPAN